jgi:VanZ family protein
MDTGLPQWRSASFLRYWLPVLLYVAAIFTLSAQPGLRAPLEFENSDKLYHLFEYLVLGVLIARTFANVLSEPRPLLTTLLTIAIGALIATSDELFQSTVPNRQSSFYDGLADTLGIALGQLLYWRWRERRAQQG